MRYTISIVAIVAVFPAWAGGLTGETRYSFVTNVVEGCLIKERASPELKRAGFAESEIATFCTCKGETLADGISIAELQSLAASYSANSQLPAAWYAKVQSAIEACYKAWTPSPGSSR
jgi:hypothetical protein